MSDKTIIVQNLSKSFSYTKKTPGVMGALKDLFKSEKLSKDAVKNISFTVNKGEFVGFLGPNGAGKTTTLKMLSGILYPSGGHAVVLGYVPWTRQDEYKKKFSIVMGQKQQLWPDLPAYEGLLLQKEIYEVPDKAFGNRLKELTAMLNVEDLLNVQLRKLSLGERMKFELIAALIYQPQMLFLDEPTIGLDVVAQKRVREFLKEYNRKHGVTILLTSHYMQDVQELCSRVIVIHEGSLLFDGELKKLMENYVQEKIIKLEFDNPTIHQKLETLGKIVKRDQFSATLSVPRRQIQEKVRAIVNSLDITDISVEEIPIEKVIREIFEKKSYTSP
ncbi:ATP-binding cassette domain-containing protein [Patescibacteria group bacterium]|nr:ATP-binding cassette domain-containing protein [Patescibacteria group bacterium]